MADRDLQFSYWVVTMRPFLKRVGFGVAALLSCGLLVLGVLYGARAWRSSADVETMITQLATSWVSPPSSRAHVRPPEIDLGTTTLLQDTQGDYSAVAMITNPSDRWALMSADVTWTFNGKIVATSTTTLRPSEQRAVAAFRLPLTDVPANAQIELALSNPTWRRITSPLDLPSVNFEVMAAHYMVLTNTPRSKLSSVTANLKNASVESFPNVEVTALLMDGTSVVGVGQLLLNDVKGLTTRAIDLRFSQVQRVTNVLVVPAVNLTSEPAS